MTNRNTALLLAAGLAAAATTGCTSTQTAGTTPANTPTNTQTVRGWQNDVPAGDPLALSTTAGHHGMRFAAGDTPSTANLQPEMLSRSAFAETRGPGGNLSQVTFSLEGADFDPDVSRDGQRIVFASTQHRATADIYIKDVTSRVVTQLTNEPAQDVMPKISPDGTRIAFASNRTGAWNIYVMPITGGRAIQITNGNADDLHPSWSPDGSQLVFCRLGEVSGQWELWITEVANNGVAKFIGNGLFPQWCPVPGSGADGADKIAFQRSRERGDRSFSIWTIDVRRGQAFNSTEIASVPTGACINPAWSPDGKWIAYATVPNPGEWASNGRPPTADLYLVDLSGSNRVSLTSGGGVNLMPTWSSNDRLFFVSNRAGVDNVWALDTSTVMKLAQTNTSNATFTGNNNAAWTNPTVVTVPETTGGGSH